MSCPQRACLTRYALLGVAACLTLSAAAQHAALNPLIRSGASQQIAPHTWTILDEEVRFVPNVGIVVGEDAMLVIDTGLGERNGQTVLAAARALGGERRLYFAATHYHPEHELGAGAFPESATLLRWAGQQREIDTAGAATIERFRAIDPVVADLLADVAYRPADLVFEESLRVDLGGVHVRVTGVGPNHTLGDTVFFVEEDRILFAGDVIMPRFPSASAESGDLDQWAANMHAFAALEPQLIVPAHGRLLDAGSIALFSAYLASVQAHVAQLASAGLDHAAREARFEAIAADIAAEFPALQPVSGSPVGRIVAALRAASRVLP